MQISEKTLEELEFGLIRKLLAENCNYQRAHEKAQKLLPFKSKRVHQAELEKLNELFLGIKSGDHLPSFYAGEINTGLEQLKIPDYQVSLEHFITFRDTAQCFKDIQSFFAKREERYPKLKEHFQNLTYETFIVSSIERIVDLDGGIKSSASEKLSDIRQSLEGKKQELQRLFQLALNKHLQQSFLAETRESFMEGRRVLSVLSENKRNVKGRILGLSNTGRVTYVEPEETIECSNDIVYLENEEQNEIARILFKLSAEIRPYAEDLRQYHEYLCWLDLLRAKLKLGDLFAAVIPQVKYQAELIKLNKAFHPVLLYKAKSKKEVVPQSLHLDRNARFLVISGPNAGGKSISLKTIGLLQCMVQAALPVPVEESSEFGWFKQLFSDIGDNQSIDNELSTYSYRLKQMRHFLESSNASTLVLIDEFGSGSDPELGGALAEACMEELYRSNCFAVLTTHYGNIKVLVDRLEAAQNASMLFDAEKLSPTYNLVVGHAGSSFTFEVAEKMGFRKALLNKARHNTNLKKVNLDKSLANAQQHESELKALRNSYREAQQMHKDAREALESRSQYYEEQFKRLQEQLQRNEKYVQWGRKFAAFIESMPGNKKLDSWLNNIKQYAVKEQVKIEGLKQKDIPKPQAKRTKKDPISNQKKLDKEPKKALDQSLLQKAKAQAPKTIKTEKPVKVGSTVSILGSATKGKVIEIKKGNALVEISGFKSQVKLENLKAV
ncbi:MAG: endonuclease MutS2 [Luteibaculum sp.]